MVKSTDTPATTIGAAVSMDTPAAAGVALGAGVGSATPAGAGFGDAGPSTAPPAPRKGAGPPVVLGNSGGEGISKEDLAVRIKQEFARLMSKGGLTPNEAAVLAVKAVSQQKWSSALLKWPGGQFLQLKNEDVF
jgi:hypothetical protein